MIRVQFVSTLLFLIGISLPAVAQEETAEQSLSQWKDAFREAMKSEVETRAKPEHIGAVVDLCRMYALLQIDARYETSPFLQSLSIRLRRRLLDVHQDIRADLKRKGIDVPTFTSVTNRSTGLQDFTPDTNSEPSPGGGFGPGADNGLMLIELITRTVSPEFWTEQGGPGSMYYYGLHRVLVVRATTRMHEDIQALLQALRGMP